MRKLYPHTCPSCGNDFQSLYADNKFCSRDCANAARREGPYTRVCPGCQQEFITRRKTQFCCSIECGYKQRQGEGHFNYKGGYVNVNGYRMLCIAGRMILEHRLVMEQKLGQPLPPDIHVHHLDGDKLNNDPSNLAMVTNREHQHLHRRLFQTDTHKECSHCHEVKSRDEFAKRSDPGRDPNVSSCKACHRLLYGKRREVG